MARYEWSETFMSVEGEAKYTGWPTVYIRFSRCNFQCRGFNNPNNVDTTSAKILGFDPRTVWSLENLPPIHTGCDSIYSWDEKFSHLWHTGNENELANEVIKVLPYNSWINPRTGQHVILSLTGGEPTLRIKFWPELLNTEQFKNVKHVLIETNCSVPLKEKYIEQLFNWALSRHAKVTWSNSPKLSRSGEKWEDAIRPEIAAMQMFNGGNGIFEQYFKFVCAPTESDFDEVEKAMQAYYSAGIKQDVEVYIMPVACLEEQQKEIAAQVARMCIDRGYIYCHRVQNSVFNNGPGT
ncbi:MAG: hypothetical protein QXL17_02750 [Candidatus Thermoplasmatota archaeon]